MSLKWQTSVQIVSKRRREERDGCKSPNHFIYILFYFSFGHRELHTGAEVEINNERIQANNVKICVNAFELFRLWGETTIGDNGGVSAINEYRMGTEICKFSLSSLSERCLILRLFGSARFEGLRARARWMCAIRRNELFLRSSYKSNKLTKIKFALVFRLCGAGGRWVAERVRACVCVCCVWATRNVQINRRQSGRQSRTICRWKWDGRPGRACERRAAGRRDTLSRSVNKMLDTRICCRWIVCLFWRYAHQRTVLSFRSFSLLFFVACLFIHRSAVRLNDYDATII